jgi:NADPH-dependent curcumin reductase CurA
MTDQRSIIVTRRPDGPLTEDVFSARTSPVPLAREDHALVRVMMLSIDPYLRTSLNAAPAVGEPASLGRVMPGRGLGEVIESRSPMLKAGDLVLGELGWQEIASVEVSRLRVVPRTAHPPSWHLGVLGVPGITALLALELIAEPKAGQTIFISSAAGAVGSAAGQIAKSFGCRTIGASSAGKRDLCRRILGFDHCLDRASSSGLRDELSKSVAEIDIMFDNVGDETVSAALPLMRAGGRIVLVGRLAHYDRPEQPPRAESPLEAILLRRLRVQGFNVRDHVDRFDCATDRLVGLADRGMLIQVDTILRDLKSAPRALCGLLNGQYTGKVLVEL